jgi:SAM-dependent methyltransferase
MTNHPEHENWHREAVAGRRWEVDQVWDRVGKRQRDFMVEMGMLPEHFVLDVGCGALRAGVHLIDYLEPGHYYGIDKEEALIKAGVDQEMPRYGVADIPVNLHVVSDFSLDHIPSDIQFDFAMAHSIFTHIVPELIERCLSNVVPRLSRDGTFFATFHLSKDGEVDLSEELPEFQSWRKGERYLTQYPISLFEEICGRLGFDVKYVGGWGHPLNYRNRQMMLSFSRKD